MTDLLRVENLSVSIDTPEGTINPVIDVDLHVGRGEIVGIVGESGSGKSTTVKAALGLLGPTSKVTSGRILLDGHGDLAGASPKALRAVRGSQIGYVCQNPFASLNPIYSIERQFRELFRAHGRGYSKARSREVALELLASVGISDPPRVLRGYAHQLSGGMAQRVVIALANALDPVLLIADEPTTGLDATVQAQILDLVSGLVMREQRSMLLVTHDLGVIAQYCHRVVVMKDSRVVETGPVMQVMVEPRHPYTRALLDAVPRGDSHDDRTAAHAHAQADARADAHRTGDDRAAARG